MRRQVVSLLSLLFAVAGTAVAQDQPSAEFVQVLQVTVKPSGVTEYEDFIKKVIGAAAKAGAPQQIFTYQPSQGAPGYTYDFVVPFNKWAELDAFPAVPQLLAKSLGDLPAAAAIKAGRANVERSETLVHRLLRSLSAPRVPQHAFANVIMTEVEPAMAPMYEMYLAKLKAAQDQTPGTPTTFRFVSVQGPAATYVTVQFFNKFADRDSFPAAGDALRKAYGEAEARHLTETSLRAIRHRRTYISAFRPDLSRIAAAK